jgi:ubiquinone/menaquinone biosynthesis C-methylase UbiE
MHNRYKNLVENAATDDSGLTAVGWEQADLLAAWLRAHETIDVLVSGVQLHSRLTTQRIGQALQLPVTVAQDMPSRLDLESFPAPPPETDDLDPEIHTSVHNAVVAPYVEFHHGLITTLNRLLHEHRGKTVAVVTSGSAIATILRHFFGAHKLQVRIEHTALSEISYHNGQWRLMYINRREHIPCPPLRPPRSESDATSVPEESEDPTSVAQFYNDMADQIMARYTDSGAMEESQRIRQLLKFAQLPDDLHILDIGSGLGILTLALAANGAREVIGVDMSLAMLEHAEYIRLSNPSPITPRVNYRLASAQRLPFRDARFDAVVCHLVLHQAHAPEPILREIVRVLRPEGILIIGDLLGSDDPVRRATYNAIESRRNPCHATARSASQYRALVEDAGGLTVAAERTVTFERDLERWLSEFQSDSMDQTAVREMVEAGLETDAPGINARRQGNRLVFDQRVYYLKAIKSNG